MLFTAHPDATEPNQGRNLLKVKYSRFNEACTMALQKWDNGINWLSRKRFHTGFIANKYYKQCTRGGWRKHTHINPQSSTDYTQCPGLNSFSAPILVAYVWVASGNP